jgi:hypothetical protein
MDRFAFYFLLPKDWVPREADISIKRVFREAKHIPLFDAAREELDQQHL